jgi:hypothetical protein
MYSQFMWGLANGIVVLAVAGGFFLGAAAASTPVAPVQWLGLALTALGFLLLLRGGARSPAEGRRISVGRLQAGHGISTTPRATAQPALPLSLALPAVRLSVLCVGLGLTMWLTALDSVLRADRLVARWSGDVDR